MSKTKSQLLRIKTILTDFSPTTAKTRIDLPSMSPADVYAACLALLLLPLAMVFWILFSLLSFPLVSLGALYMHCFVPSPTDFDDSNAFIVSCVLTFPYAALLYILASLYWYLMALIIFLLSLPVMLFRILLLCQLGDIIHNFQLLYPWMKFNHFSYFMLCRAILGECHRQGLWEFMFGKYIMGGFPGCVAYVVLLKYIFSSNPLLFVLSEMHINQWSPPISKMDKDEAIAVTRKFVSRFKHEEDEARHCDNVKFAAVYPFGKSIGTKPDSVIGIQFPEQSKMVNFTNTIHVTKEYRNRFSLPNKNCRSIEGAEGIYVVELNWFSFHFCTGYVEVNYRLDGGLEHPMWCIVAQDNYWSMKYYGFVNNLFANFVPDVIEFLLTFDEKGNLEDTGKQFDRKV